MVRTKTAARKNPPRKRSKGEGSSSQPEQQPQDPLEHYHCRDHQALERYHELTRQDFPTERSFVFDDVWDQHPELRASIQGQIDAQGWGNFVRIPPAGSRNFVWEFYANGYDVEIDSRISYVRGHRIGFEAEHINLALGIPPIQGRCAYLRLKRRGANADYDDISRVLCGREGAWRTNVQNHPTSLDKMSLTLEAKIWQFFINSRVYPSLNIKIVTMERARVLYCILTRRRMNVGGIISHQMFKNFYRREGQLPKLLYPSLICSLIARVNVPVEATDLPLLRKPQEDFTGAWVRARVREEARRRPPPPPPQAAAAPPPTFQALTPEQHAEAAHYGIASHLYYQGIIQWHYAGAVMGTMPQPPPQPAWYYYHGYPAGAAQQQQQAGEGPSGVHDEAAGGAEEEGEEGGDEGDEGDDGDGDEIYDSWGTDED